MKTVWTAMVHTSGGFIHAQAKSSKAELIRRVRADDPIWRHQMAIFYRATRWPNKHFSRGLAFRFFPNQLRKNATINHRKVTHDSDHHGK